MDNWKHRASNMKCGTCMYFVVKIATDGKLATPEPKAERDLGRCRRHAPTMSGFPAVYSNDWCGDHKIDENKI